MDHPSASVLAKVGLDATIAASRRGRGALGAMPGCTQSTRAWQTPEAVVRAVADEDADWLGLSLLSGAQ